MNTQPKSDFVKHIGCDHCGSSDLTFHKKYAIILYANKEKLCIQSMTKDLG